MVVASKSCWRAPKWGLLVMLLITLLASSAEARTLRVEKDGSGDFTVIQDAVEAAASGDTLRIGPGRFSEYANYQSAGNIWHIYVHFRSGALTIIGAGEESTFIGPETPDTWGQADLVIGLLFWPPGGTDTLRLSSITFSDSITGVYVQYGSCTVEQCTSVRLKYGVRTFAPCTILNCTFEEIRQYGAIAGSAATPVLIEHCLFRYCLCPFSLQLVASADVVNCEILSCLSAGIFDRSAGSMRNCTVRLDRPTEWDYGLEVWGPGTYTITDNSFEGGGFNIIFGQGASNVTCERNIFTESRDEAIRMVSCTPVIRNNDILKGTGVAVRLDGYPQLPDLTVDMTNNYWGTTVADSISAWIIDGHDVTSPSLHGFVNYEPFARESVPAQKKSLGDVKAMFRGGFK